MAALVGREDVEAAREFWCHVIPDVRVAGEPVQ
jgi:hypothetical protein